MDINTNTIREYLQGPPITNTRFGKWGALNIQQRKIIWNMCDYIDYQDKLIKQLLEEQKSKCE